MNTPQEELDLQLDRLLNESAPPVKGRDDAVGRDLATLVARSGRAAGRVWRRPRLVFGVGVSALLLAGGGVAVANDLLWTDWVEKPVAEYTFNLPSGNTCTSRVGDVSSADPRVEGALVGFYSSDVTSRVDIDAVMELRRTQHDNAQLADGTIVDIVPGSPLYNADRDYRNAMSIAIGEALGGYLREQGLSLSWTNHSELLCTNDDEMKITPEDLGYGPDDSEVDR